MLGYAMYVNVKGERVYVTEVNRDPRHKHPYKDSVSLGQVTHVCQVEARYGTKKQRRELGDLMWPMDMMYDQRGLYDFNKARAILN